jgi:hypothetical protein
MANTRIQKLKLSIENEVDSPVKVLKSERKSNSYIFDYKEHAMFIFDVFNLFRTKPQKFYKKMIKNGLWEDSDGLSDSIGRNIKWSDDIYNMLYIRDGIEDKNTIYEIISSECVVFRIDGDYDPEMSVLMLLKKYKNEIETLLSNDYNVGTVNSYNDPDRIFFYLFKIYYS